MISDQDRIKVCDFGLSRLRGKRLERPPHLVIGSPFYAARAGARSGRADQRADLYSAVVIVHRMLTGSCPRTAFASRATTIRMRMPAGTACTTNKLPRARPAPRFSTADEICATSRAEPCLEQKKESFCRTAGEAVRGGPTAGARKALRRRLSRPERRGPGYFRCDALMAPLRYSEPTWAHTADGAVVLDPESGLAWQASGSADPLDWHAARGYVERLNTARFAGCSRWRLPTVDELLSILRPPVLGVRDCIAPAFDRKQKTLWSCDRRTFMSAWHADMELGFAGFADFTCRFYVRAVTETRNIGSRKPA